MKLVVAELTSSGLEQIVVPSKNTIVEAIRPHIYRHNFAAGSLKLSIYDSLNNLVAESDPVAISSIQSLAYFHGYVRFNINAYLKRDQEYRIKLTGTGYTFSESAYIGWCNGFDLGKYDPITTPISDFAAPFDLEIWERTEK